LRIRSVTIFEECHALTGFITLRRSFGAFVDFKVFWFCIGSSLKGCIVNARERIRAILKHQCPDRIGISDSYWIDTIERWHKEGLPEGMSPSEYFDFDIDYIYMDASLRLPEKILEETGEYVIRTDKHGFTAKEWKNKSGALGYLNHKIKTKQDWDKCKSRLKVDFGGTSRIDTFDYFDPFVKYSSWKEAVRKFRELRKKEKFILLTVYGPLEATWRKHGFERTLTNMLLEPELIHNMFSAHTDLVIDTTKKGLREGIRPDGLFLIEDMGFTSGMQFSLKIYKKLLFPEHKRLGDFLNDQDIHYFMHSDGDIKVLIPFLIEAGVEVLQPIEADVLDIRKLKKKYGEQLTFWGNIDARRMSGTKEEIEEEVKSKIMIAKEDGGYIYHSDHSVPPDVSFDNYRYLMDLIKRYGEY